MPKFIHLQRQQWREMVFADPQVNAACFKTAFALSSYVNIETGTAWPSVTRLASESHVDQKTIQRHFKRLKRCGYIKLVGKRRGGTTNEYQLVMPGDDEAEDTDVPHPGQTAQNRRDVPVPQSIDDQVKPLTKPLPKKAHRPNADRGAMEMRIANRLGEDGYAIVLELSETDIARYCAMERQGRLSDRILLEVRQRASAHRLGAASTSPYPRGA